MKKQELYLSITWIFIGLLVLSMAIYGSVHAWKADSLLWGFTGATLGQGLMRLQRYFHWSKPENREEYARRQKAEHIAQHDERNVMLRDKSGRLAYVYTMMLHWILFVLSSVWFVMDWVEPYARFAMVSLSILLLVEYGLGIWTWHQVGKKA